MLNPPDFRKVKTYPLRSRASKVRLADVARVPRSPASTRDWLASLPEILAAKNFRAFVEAVVKAHRGRRPVLLMMGAHMLKCGLGPLILHLLQKRIVTAVAVTGASVVHDFELAYQGATSEDVAENLDDGSFGFAEETGRIINEAVSAGARRGWGIGEAIGREILRRRLPHRTHSLFANAVTWKIPVTVHVGIGTDIIYQHPACDGAAWGQGSYRDFKTLTGVVGDLRGGVVMNWGSAVILPEVFLKALSVARNLGRKADGFTAANFDMNVQYRPLENIIRRPTTKGGGRGYTFVGHHEIMFPLFVQAVRDRLGRR